MFGSERIKELDRKVDRLILRLEISSIIPSDDHPWMRFTPRALLDERVDLLEKKIDALLEHLQLEASFRPRDQIPSHYEIRDTLADTDNKE